MIEVANLAPLRLIECAVMGAGVCELRVARGGLEYRGISAEREGQSGIRARINSAKREGANCSGIDTQLGLEYSMADN